MTETDRIEKAIQTFVKHRIGGVIVCDGEDTIIYQDARIILSDHARSLWVKRKPGVDEEKSWEFSDVEDGKYYRIESASVHMEGEVYQCHLFTDVSDYATLFQDISDYSRQIADVSDFQKSILSKLSLAYDSCLPDLVAFCNATDGLLFMEEERTGMIQKTSYSRSFSRHAVEPSEEIEYMLNAKRFEFAEGYYCFLSETTGTQRYALFLRRGQKFNEEYFRDASVYNVIRLYIENGILREKIVYESEHDKLTGLYNKGKYLSLREQAFGRPKKLAVMNFDVNNLKLVNDEQGHEVGDQLIVKAAGSIDLITNEQIMAFRTGGDEFVVIACNVSEDEANELLRRWEEGLRKKNEADDGLHCTVASGLACGENDYDLEELLNRADERMYENKKKMKAALGLPTRR